mmetsp:Transcript_83316/g.222776  ORF Transcript_83316/g.222776 Transcript_83316/m.222776 type:complete len:309 (+) Transcript_83316:1430-2356(+)
MRWQRPPARWRWAAFAGYPPSWLFPCVFQTSTHAGHHRLGMLQASILRCASCGFQADQGASHAACHPFRSSGSRLPPGSHRSLDPCNEATPERCNRLRPRLQQHPRRPAHRCSWPALLVPSPPRNRQTWTPASQPVPRPLLVLGRSHESRRSQTLRPSPPSPHPRSSAAPPVAPPPRRPSLLPLLLPLLPPPPASPPPRPPPPAGAPPPRPPPAGAAPPPPGPWRRPPPAPASPAAPPPRPSRPPGPSSAPAPPAPAPHGPPPRPPPAPERGAGAAPRLRGTCDPTRLRGFRRWLPGRRAWRSGAAPG